jgi:hypothetical protein
MSTSLVLYVLLGSFGIGLCLWAAISAVVPVAEHRGAHRFWTLVAALLLPAVTAPLVLGDPTGTIPSPGMLVVALPSLALLCAWSNTVTLRAQGFGLRLLHLPVQAWNALLAGLYTLLVLQELYGLDVGTGAATLVAAFVDLQVFVGDPDAAANPRWLYLPFALPLCHLYRWHQKLALLAASLAASGMLAAFVQGLPLAHLRVSTFRAPAGCEVGPVPERVVLGVVVPLDAGPRGPQHTVRLAQRSYLGARALAIEVTGSTFTDPARLAAAKHEIEGARAEGLMTLAIVPSPERFSSLPARDLDELSSEMARPQWLAAEQLDVDWVVLFVGPFSRLAPRTVLPPTIDEWTQRIARASSEARQANPRVKTMVTLEGTAPHVRELFERLMATDGPVDAVGLLESPGDGPVAETERTIASHAEWTKRTVGTRPVFVFVECGHSAALGGEVGQVRYLETVIAGLTRCPHVAALVLDSLFDHDLGGGLCTSSGRRRLATTTVRECFLPAQPAPPR